MTSSTGLQNSDIIIDQLRQNYAYWWVIR